MSQRRTHSSIDSFPAELQAALQRMLIDNEWPVDFPTPPKPKGKPKYKDLVKYCMHKGYPASLSAVGRFGVRMRLLSRMKENGVIVRDVMADLTAEKASATQKAVAEMITAAGIEFVTTHEKMKPKEIRDMATAMRDCASISMSADKYIREQVSKKVTAACEKTKDKLSKAGVDTKLIQQIIDEHLGVVKS